MNDAPPRRPPPPRHDAGPPRPPPPSPPVSKERLSGATAAASFGRASLAPVPMTAGQKETLASQALGLLNEQVQARIVHYKGELQTSPELDAITAQVVAELKAMQAAARLELAQKQSPEQREEQQRRAFTALLARIFPRTRNTRHAS